jgi:hypothetical protein
MRSVKGHVSRTADRGLGSVGLQFGDVGQ